VAADGPLVVLYDQDCGWCRWSIARVLAFDRQLMLQPEPIQGELGERLLAGLPVAERLASAHAVTPDGRVHSGGDAAAPIAAVLPLLAPAAPLLRAFAPPTRWGYRFVADHRSTFGRLVSLAMRERADVLIARHHWNVTRRPL
jgi:predicted DCC family thiol-disulfide oxidoreductase YuxK